MNGLVFEARSNGFAREVHSVLNVLWTLANGGYGLVDGHRKGMLEDEVDGASPATQYVVGTIKCDRYDGQLKFVGQLIGTAEEWSHLSRQRPLSFWEDHERRAVLKHLACPVVCLLQRLGTSLVDKDVSCRFAGLPDEGCLAQFALHHPLKVASQIAVDKEDVERTLMVGDKDVGGLVVNIIMSFRMDGQQENAHKPARPHMAGPVTPEMGRTDGGTNDGGQCRHNGDDN